jgi:hypothetical protein
MVQLSIETFRNADLSQGWRPGNNAGGSTLFKALGHPLAARLGEALVKRLRGAGPVAIFDPTGAVANTHAYFDFTPLERGGYYVQRVEDLGKSFLGQSAKLVSDIGASGAKTVFILLFDAERPLASLRHLFPKGAQIVTLDALRIPADMLTKPADYLDPLNFATNFALFRDIGTNGADTGLYTRLVSANYWSGHGAKDPALWLCLFDEAGRAIAEWREALPKPGAAFVLDSREIKKRFNLPDFTGSLFIHAIRIAGHDVVKYALDFGGEAGHALTCTHDANAWPADFYAGMPAPETDETLTLYVQNSHPARIPAGALGFNIMGAQRQVRFEEEIPPFGTRAVSLNAMLPEAKWPDQIEIDAGRYFVRPRYEVVRRVNGHACRRIAHANVERTDLKPDPKIPGLAEHLGKGYLMPLPVLPRALFKTIVTPTPMARDEHEMPLRVELFDASGATIASRYLGRLARREHLAVSIEEWLAEEGKSLPAGYGHVEFLYDFRQGGEANGWLHALARVEQKSSGHRAETIFGAHIYNVPAIYKDEPQSYINKPPGLTTRLFLRLGGTAEGANAQDGMCHLIYPASKPWHAKSDTMLILHDGEGNFVSERSIAIPCGGSHFFRYTETFPADDRRKAGPLGYIIIRDVTCRLFGFHGLIQGEVSFCLDHMFGF